MRASSSRVRCGSTHSPSPAACSTAPRYSSQRRRTQVRRAARSSPASSRPDAVATAPNAAIASTSDGSMASAYPPSRLAITDGSPNARRSMATFDCSVLRRALRPPADHKSSTSRSAPTGAPASSARRTTSSEVFPARHRHALAVAGDLERAEHRNLEHPCERKPDRQRPASGRRQGIVSAHHHSERMPPDIEVLLLRLIGGDATAPGEILELRRARTTRRRCSSPLRW